MAISAEALRDTDWGDLSTRIAGYIATCLGRRSSPEDVDDLTQECIRRILDPDHSRWEPDQGSLSRFAFLVAQGLLRNRARRAGRRERGLHLLEAAPFAGTSFEPADRACDTLWGVDRLRTAVRGDEAATLVLEELLRGRERISDLRALPLSESEIVNAKRRIRRQIAKARIEAKRLTSSR